MAGWAKNVNVDVCLCVIQPCVLNLCKNRVAKKIKSRLTVQKTIFWNYRKNKMHDNYFEVVLMYFCLWTCNKVLYQTVGGQFNENNPASASFSSCAQCCTDSVITCSATNTAASWARPRDRLGLSGLTSSDFSQKPRPTEITKKKEVHIYYISWK